MMMISHHAQDAVSTSINSFELTVFFHKRFSWMKCNGQYSTCEYCFWNIFYQSSFFCEFEVVQTHSWIDNRPWFTAICTLFLDQIPRISLLVLSSSISPQMFRKHLMVWNFAEKRVDWLGNLHQPDSGIGINILNKGQYEFYGKMR